MHTPHNVKTRQHGAVLIVSLLVLLVLTLIGVSSLDGSIMEEKMASNSQIAATTFQTAESAIRAAYFVELDNPFEAVNKNRVDEAPVDRSDNNSNIFSASGHRYDPADLTVNTPNSSSNIVGSRPFEIVGTARVGAIQSVHTQGYLVLNVPRLP